MVFTFESGNIANSQPVEYRAGTNEEAFVVGEILTLSSGVLTAAGVDTDGTQKYICLAAKTGDGSTKDIPVVELTKTMKFRTTSSGEIAASAVGSSYTLATSRTSITATTTKGCFTVDETDGATTSEVVGHFNSVL